MSESGKINFPPGSAADNDGDKEPENGAMRAAFERASKRVGKNERQPKPLGAGVPEEETTPEKDADQAPQQSPTPQAPERALPEHTKEGKKRSRAQGFWAKDGNYEENFANARRAMKEKYIPVALGGRMSKETEQELDTLADATLEDLRAGRNPRENFRKLDAFTRPIRDKAIGVLRNLQDPPAVDKTELDAFRARGRKYAPSLSEAQAETSEAPAALPEEPAETGAVEKEEEPSASIEAVPETTAVPVAEEEPAKPVATKRFGSQSFKGSPVEDLSDEEVARRNLAEQQKTRDRERIAEIRARLANLERMAQARPSSSPEEEILALEKELRAAERQAKGLPPQGEATLAELKRELADAVPAAEPQPAVETAPPASEPKTYRAVWTGRDDAPEAPTPRAEAAHRWGTVQLESANGPLDALGAAIASGAFAARKEKVAVDLAERAGLGKERDAMLGAERAWLDAQHEFHMRHSAFGRWRKRVFGADYDRNILSPERRYNAAAAQFEQALEMRLAGRVARMKERGASDENINDFTRRYRRMVVSKDVIDHGEERLKATREGALDEKGRNALETGLMWAAGQNQELEKHWGKTGARIARVLGAAAIGTGIASVFAPAAVVLGAGAVGARILRGLVGTFGGAAVGAGAGLGYQHTFGARRERQLTEARETAGLTKRGMESKREAYRKGNKEAVALKRSRVEAIAALLAGAGLSYETAHLLASHEAVGRAVDEASKLPKGGGALVGQPPTVPPAGVEHAPPATVLPSAEHLPAYPSVEAAHHLGYENMANRLRTELLDKGFKASDFPKDSDAYRLLSTTDKPQLNTLLHRLAEDPTYAQGGHDFYHHADAHSVLIKPDSHLTVGKDGTLLFGEAGAAPTEVTPTPEQALHTTLPYHPEAAQHAAAPAVPASETASQPPPAPAEAAAPSGSESASIETAPPVTPSAEQLLPFSNHLGTSINPAEGHVFADATGAMTAYGNDFNMRFLSAQDYVKAHPGATVWVQADRPTFFRGAWRPFVFPVHSDEAGKVIVQIPTEVSPAQVGAVDPENFTKQIF